MLYEILLLGPIVAIALIGIQITLFHKRILFCAVANFVYVYIIVPLVVIRGLTLEVQLDSVEVTSMRVPSNVSADFDFTLTLENKDQYLLYCNETQFSLEYHNESLSSTALEPFLMIEDHHQLKFGMRINDLQHKAAGSIIARDFWGLDFLEFALKGQGNCVRRISSAPDRCTFNVLCEDITIAFSSANNLTTGGSMVGSPLLCNVHTHCTSVRARLIDGMTV